VFSNKRRIILPERLAHESEEAAAPSLRDLIRINSQLGGHRAVRRALSALVSPADRFSVLDVGAASGDMGRSIVKSYPRAKITSLDYKADHLAKADPPKVAGDAFHLPFRPGSFDFVFCSSFLHHFADAEVTDLFRQFGSCARRAVIAADIERHVLPYLFLPATRWLFHWNTITLHDGPISVQAAFHAHELEALARAAGLARISVQVSRPAFRLVLVARVDYQ